MASLNFAAFTSDELEFMAENELVLIEPKFTNEGPVHFIMGDFGPFTPGVPVNVPLWFAVRLRQESLCRIIPPAWLSVDELQRTLAAERASAQALTALPFHYLEIAVILHDSAAEDLVQPEKVQELVDDIEKCRAGKLNGGLREVLKVATREMVPHALRVDHISAMEVNMLRAGVFKALDHVVAMGDAQISRDRKQEESVLRGGGVGGRARVRLQQGGRGGGGGAASLSAAGGGSEAAAAYEGADGEGGAGAGLGGPSLDESAPPEDGPVDLG